VSTSDARTYVVEGMTCGHCRLSVTEEVAAVSGVEAVDADITTGRLTVRGEDIDDTAVREAVAEAGYRLAA
jgi:copper chaperone CopZ